MKVFLLCGIMEGWSLLLQESPCLMVGGMEGWRGVEKEEEGNREEKVVERELKGGGWSEGAGNGEKGGMESRIKRKKRK